MIESLESRRLCSDDFVPFKVLAEQNGKIVEIVVNKPITPPPGVVVLPAKPTTKPAPTTHPTLRNDDEADMNNF